MRDPEYNIQPWKTLSSQPLGDYRVFRVRSDQKQHPRTGRLFDLFVIECPNWVTVVATTPANELILVGQYRHGTNSIEWEVPGGIIDPDDADPLAAGIRELREETAYAGDKARMLGYVFPNPALQNNRCYAVRVEHCLPTGSQDLDDSEDIAVRLVPWKEVPQLIRSGIIRHSLALTSLMHALLEDGTWQGLPGDSIAPLEGR